MYAFKKEGDVYHYFGENDSDLVYIANEVGIIFDTYTFSIMKHGPADRIEALYSEMRQKYLSNGLEDIADELRMLRSSDWDPEELTRLLATSGSVRAFLERNNLQSDDEP